MTTSTPSAFGANFTDPEKKAKSVPKFDENESITGAQIKDFMKKRQESGNVTRFFAKGKVITITKPVKVNILIRFLSRIGIPWELLINFVLLVYLWLMSYCAVFAYYDKKVWRVLYALDAILFFDVTLRLLIEIWRHVTKTPCQIFILQYSFWQFLLDVVSLFPITTIVVSICGTNSVTGLNRILYCRFNRIFRLIRVFHVFDKMTMERQGNSKALILLKYVYEYGVMIHFFACCMYGVNEVTYIDWILGRGARIADNPTTANWLVLRHESALFNNEKTPHHIELYYLTVEFVVAIVTTVGFGDVYPFHIIDIFLAIFIMVVGAVFIQGSLGSILTEFHLDQDVARFDLFFRLKGIEKYLKEIKAPPIYHSKLVEYYKSLWNYREGVSDVHMKGLSISMQEELMFDICEEMFHHSTLFRDLDQNFLQGVSKISKINLYIPHMLLCREGVYCTDMHYVIQGELRVCSKYDPSNVACILRAGSIVGEVNLLFSFPALTTIETNSVCQILTICKQEFVKFLENHPTESEIIRQRLQNRFTALRTNYKLTGYASVSWVQRKEREKKVKSTPSTINFPCLPITLRKSKYFNTKVTKDIIDDSNGTYIATKSKSSAKIKSKDHYACYRNCTVESVFTSGETWVRAWTIFVLLSTLVHMFVVPYCGAYVNEESNDLIYCKILAKGRFLVWMVHILDLLVEIYVATPSTGLQYRFRDGLLVCTFKLTFWIDAIACMPDEMIHIFGMLKPGYKEANHFYFPMLVRSIFKAFKILRFLRHLDNVFPLHIFVTRLLKSVVFLVYGIHMIGCFFFSFVCRRGLGTDCTTNSWMNTYYLRANDAHLKQYLHEDVLRQKMPFLASLFFSSAIVTSAGYGDFVPQQRPEFIVAVLCMILGVFLFTYITAGLTSALSCGVRPKLVFHQKLLAIRKFMDHHQLSDNIQNQVIEHYVLQNQFVDGILLPPHTSHLLYDAPSFMVENTLLWEVEVFLEGIPLFSKCDPIILTRMAKTMKRFVIPPNLTYVERGEVRRSMSVLAKGSVGLFTTDGEKHAILEATGHFGIRDLLFGEPHEYFVKTKSYCLLYTIDFQNFIDSFEGFEDKMFQILYKEKSRIVDTINNLVYVRGFDTHRYDKSTERPVRIKSFIFFPWRKNKETPECSHEEYKEIYNELTRFSWLYKAIMMPVTIHPAGKFAIIWTVFIALVSCIIINCAFIENFMQYRSPTFRIFQLLLDCINWIHVYLRLHWCYYGAGNILISHPIKTSTNYVHDGLFAYDVIFSTPFELIFVMIGGTNLLGYGAGASWYTKFRMVRCFQVYRVSELFRIVHSFFRQRTLILVLFYVVILGSFSTVLGSIAVYLACPTFPRIWQHGDEYNLPACLRKSWINEGGLETINTSLFVERYTAAIYYVQQCISVIGFGDIVQLKETDLKFIMMVTVFGFLFAQVIISDMTAAQLDTDEVRAKFREERRCLLSCLQRERVPWKIRKSIGDHLNFVWESSRGLQPRELFQDVHPAIASNIFQEFVGETLKNVPLFQNFSAQVLRSMSQLLKKQYFLKGERITRFGQLEFEMFIIAEGRVYMIDGSNNYVTTLKRKDFFGELSMLFGKQRRHSAIAASKVELFILNADDFAEVIEKYPAVKDEILQTIHNGHHEFFVQKHRKKKRQDPEKWKKKSDVLTIEVLKLIKNQEVNIFTLKMKESQRKFKFSRYVCGFGPKDDNLPFLYFAAPGYKDCKCKFLIHPNCLFWKIIKRIIPIVYFIVPVLTMYNVFFLAGYKNATDPKKAHLYEIDQFSEIILYCTSILEWVSVAYMLLNFIVPFKMGNGQYCKVFGRIVLNYVTSIDGFILDLLGCFPVDIFSFYNSSFAGSRYIAFVKFVRLIQFYKAIWESKDDLNLSALRYKLAFSGSTFFLMTHTLACLMYWVCIDEKGNTQNITWMAMVEEEDFQGMTADESEHLQLRSVWYLRSIYYVFTILTSCGFGDNLPQSFNEYILVNICIIFGFFAVAIVVGSITTGLAAIQKAKREYFYKVRTHVNHLRSIGLSKERQDLMMAHYVMQWEVCRGNPYHKATSILPLTMQFDSCALIFGQTIRKCNFFGNTKDPIFVRNLAIRLSHRMFLPGVNIINQGEAGSSLYIVYKGIVSSYLTNDETGIPEFKRRYEKYECFGRIPCLFKKMVYSRNYRAETQVEILQLHSTDILHLISHYPGWLKILKNMINTRYPDVCRIRPDIFAPLEKPKS